MLEKFATPTGPVYLDPGHIVMARPQGKGLDLTLANGVAVHIQESNIENFVGTVNEYHAALIAGDAGDDQSTDQNEPSITLIPGGQGSEEASAGGREQRPGESFKHWQARLRALDANKTA